MVVSEASRFGVRQEHEDALSSLDDSMSRLPEATETTKVGVNESQWLLSRPLVFLVIYSKEKSRFRCPVQPVKYGVKFHYGGVILFVTFCLP